MISGEERSKILQHVMEIADIEIDLADRAHFKTIEYNTGEQLDKNSVMTNLFTAQMRAYHACNIVCKIPSTEFHVDFERKRKYESRADYHRALAMQAENNLRDYWGTSSYTVARA